MRNIIGFKEFIGVVNFIIIEGICIIGVIYCLLGVLSEEGDTSWGVGPIFSGEEGIPFSSA